MAETATVHNPSRFDPADYEVLDYLDNKRPQYFGQGIEAFEAEVAWWKADMERTFGPDWIRKIHRCVHCGNTNIRWITAVRHLPTEETVVFGSDCTARLEFTDKVSFKLALLKSRAEARTERFKVWRQREAYLDANPAIRKALDDVNDPVHADNTFVRDVLSKLDKYGYLTERQAAAVPASLARDRAIAARKAVDAAEVKGDAPSGRAEVTGVILGLKQVDTLYGPTTKALIKLGNNAKVWVTANWDVQRGDTVTVRATWTPSRDDRSFGFGSRPHLVSHVSAAQVA